MNVYVLEKFEAFCRKMYHRNCEERGDWNNTLLSYEEYTENHRGFLIDVYEKLEKKGSLNEWMHTL